MTHPQRDNAMVEHFASRAEIDDPYGPKGPGAVKARPEIVRETVRAVKPPEPRSIVPERESDDFAVLAAWYSGFAFAEHYRKVVLSECREIMRAKYALKGEKVSEARLEDLSRTHPRYLEYLAKHLHGRALWEHEYRAAGGLT